MSQTIELPRDRDGKLSAFAWPGGYELHYLADDGGMFCYQCANGENGSLASNLADPGTGWRIVGWGFHWEGEPEYCSHCSREIRSEYGVPDGN